MGELTSLIERLEEASKENPAYRLSEMYSGDDDDDEGDLLDQIDSEIEYLTDISKKASQVAKVSDEAIGVFKKLAAQGESGEFDAALMTKRIQHLSGLDNAYGMLDRLWSQFEEMRWEHRSGRRW
jgi:hypothetical protein